MHIFKRGTKYYVKLWNNGKQVLKCTGVGDSRKAERIAEKIRDELALGNFGILTPKPAPAVRTLKEFLGDRFLTWVKGTYDKPKTQKYYLNGIRVLRNSPLADSAMNEISTEAIGGYRSHRIGRTLLNGTVKKYTLATVNRELEVLRRALNMAHEWGLIPEPKIDWKLYIRKADENHRERVITPAEEAAYLLHAPDLLASAATVLVDSGFRPDEVYRMRWENVTWVNGRHGSIKNTHGKTPAARRELPMTPRVRVALETRWEAAGKPLDGWVWPTATQSGHMEPSTLKKQHRKALKLSGVRPFEIYSFRHTFLTRLGMSGIDAWTLARIAGHSDIKMSTRYVHATNDRVMAAFDGMALAADGITDGINGEKRQLNA